MGFSLEMFFPRKNVMSIIHALYYTILFSYWLYLLFGWCFYITGYMIYIHLIYSKKFKRYRKCLEALKINILIILMRLFLYGLCDIIIIMSRIIPPRIFDFISFRLIRFWESWLFNYPFTLTLSFPTLKLMDWHVAKGFISFYVSRTYVSNFSSIELVQSYWPAKLGIEFEH